MTRLFHVATSVACLCIAGSAQASETISYTYDALGRLNAVQMSDGPEKGLVRTYLYDAAGNRTRSGTVSLSALRTVANATSAGAEIGVRIGESSTGMVTFTENGVFLGSAYVSDGQASVFLEGFALGTHTITASYSEDGVNPLFSFTFTIKVQNLSWLPAVLDLILSE